jgi:hypothetical protein
MQNLFVSLTKELTLFGLLYRMKLTNYIIPSEIISIEIINYSKTELKSVLVLLGAINFNK